MNGSARVALLLLLWAAFVPAPARAQALDADEIELKVQVRERSGEMASTLASWVEMNTGSWNLPGLEQFAEVLAGPLRDLGFEVEVLPGAEIDLPGRGRVRTGPLIRGRRPATGVDAPLRLLLVGHFDTVFEPDSEFKHFAGGEPATGPGTADMKGGLVVLFEVLRALATSGDLKRASWTVLLNADEELGSLGSRPAIEAEARLSDLGFVFEAAHAGGAMVRSRRGLGQFHLSIEGRAAHAGSAHAQGRSALHEMAAKILRIEAMTDYERGLTLNVGTVRGGTKRNIVPERAEAWIDLRYDAPELGIEARGALEAIAQEIVVDGTRSQLWGRLHRPPKVSTPQVEELLARHRSVAAALGIELPEAVHAGGGTDGSLMGAVGLPTLDSMGVVGGAAHTDREYVALESLAERASLGAILLRRLLRERLYGPEGGR